MANDVKIEYYGDTSKYERATREIQRQTKAVANDMREVWGGVATFMAGVWAAKGVVSTLADFARAAGEQQQALAGLKQSMVSMGRYSPEFFDSMVSMASGLQQVTTFGDDATIAGQKFLMTYREIPDSLMPRASAAMLDLAALMGGDTSQAANMLGKAAMGLSGELRRVGITIDPVIAKSGDFAAILSEIEKQVGGQARAIAETGIGSWQQLSNLWGDAKEELGELVFAITEGMQPAIRDWIDGVNTLAKAWKDFLSGPSTMDILRQQEKAIEAQITRLQAPPLIGEGLPHMEKQYRDFANKQIPLLRKQLSIVRQTMENEIAGVYEGGKKKKGSGIFEPPIPSDVQADVDKFAQDFRLALQNVTPLESAQLMGPLSFFDSDAIKEAMSETDAFELAKGKQTELETFMLGSQQRLADMETMKRTREMNELISSTEFKKAAAQDEHDFALALANEKTMQMIAMDEKLANRKKQLYSDMISNTKGFFEIMSQEGETWFEIYKGIQIAEAVATTAQAALQAFRWGLETFKGPYAYIAAVAAAAAAGAFGLAKISAIMHAKPGGSGGTGGATGTYSANPATGLPTTTSPTAQQQNPQIVVHIHGDYIDTEEHTAALAERLTEYVQNKRGYLVSTSAQQ